MSLFALEEQLTKISKDIKEREIKIEELRKLCRVRPPLEGGKYGKELYIADKEIRRVRQEYAKLYEQYILEKRQNENLPPPVRVHLEGGRVVIDHDDQE